MEEYEDDDEIVLFSHFMMIEFEIEYKVASKQTGAHLMQPYCGFFFHWEWISSKSLHTTVNIIALQVLVAVISMLCKSGKLN